MARSGGEFSESEVAEMTDEQLIYNIEMGVSFDAPAGDMEHVLSELIKRFNALKKKRKVSK